jgi:anti-sigma B factor antagonist
MRRAFRAVPSASSVVVDLSGVTFMDAAGLGALIAGVLDVREGGRAAVVASPSTVVARLFALAKVGRFVTVLPSVEEARVATG